MKHERIMERLKKGAKERTKKWVTGKIIGRKSSGKKEIVGIMLMRDISSHLSDSFPFDLIHFSLTGVPIGSQ